MKTKTKIIFSIWNNLMVILLPIALIGSLWAGVNKYNAAQEYRRAMNQIFIKDGLNFKKAYERGFYDCVIYLTEQEDVIDKTGKYDKSTKKLEDYINEKYSEFEKNLKDE